MGGETAAVDRIGGGRHDDSAGISNVLTAGATFANAGNELAEVWSAPSSTAEQNECALDGLCPGMAAVNGQCGQCAGA
jgi:hypothetical protein